MLKNHRSFRFIVAIIAVVAISALAFAAKSSSGLGFLAPNEVAAEAPASAPAAALSPQTVVLSDNFEGATTFLTANVAATNQWFIGTAAANGGTMGAYISNDAGVTNAYGIATSSINHIYAPITVPAGESAVVLSFDWKGIGEYDATTSTFDYLRVSIISAVPVGGVSITPITGQLPIAFAGQDNYTRAHVNLPASIADGAPRFLVFTWHNDSSLGFQPPAAIDNVLVTSLVPAPLSGTKSIPGDYPTIGAAIANVNAHGADTSGGSLIFNVAAGSSFLETPVPLTASGSSATNRIIFQKSGAGPNPKITAEGSGNFGLPSGGSITSTSDAVIALNGADFVTFDGIDVASSSVQAISPFSQIEYGYLIRNNNTLANTTTANGAQNNIIQNTSITLDRRKTSSVGIMQSASTVTGAGSTATSAATSNSGNKYYNLTIQNANAGIYLLGTAAFPDDLTEVGVTTGAGTFNSIGTATANDLGSTTAATWGIRFSSQSNAKIFNNDIKNVTSTSSTATGIHMDNAGTVTAVSLGTTQIYNNQIHDINGTTSTSVGIVYGIRANLTGNAGSIARIQNNFIYGLNSSSTSTTSVRLVGINVQDTGTGTGATFNVHNNSVRIAMPTLTTISSCFVIGGAAATNPVYNVRNNIFANVTGAQAGLAKHYAWVSTSNTTIGLAPGTVSDFNDLYVTGVNGFVGRGSTIDYATLAAWQGMDPGVGPDDASFSVDPAFAGATDLHLTGASTLINVGTTIGTVTDDIDGQARPNGAGYEIGADEFVPAPGILQLSSATYAGNEGTTLVATVNRVSGSSGIVGATYTLTDGSGAVGGAACGVGVDYVNPGPTLVSLGDTVTSAPINVMLCTDAVIDPLETFTITLSLPTGGAILGSPTVATATITDVPPPFNGTYSVGTGGTYPSLTNNGGIFEAINLSGATGNITIEILSNLSGELGTHALNEIPGGFSTTMYPCSNPITITGSNAGALIRLNGADFVTINGDSDACGPPAVVGGTPASRHLTITNTSGGTSSAVVAFMSGANGAQNNAIRNVNIDGTSPTTTLFGIFMGGNTITLAAAGNGTDNDGNDVINCRVRRGQIGIYSAGAIPPNQNMGTVIQENEIDETVADRIRRIGILVQNEDGVLIDQNSVGGMDTDESADAIGIGVGTLDVNLTAGSSGGIVNASVTRNRVNGVTQSSTFAAAGIAVAGGNTPPGLFNTISNNMISGVISDATSPDLVAGIFVVGTPGSSHRLYHNSVSMTGDRSTFPGSGGTGQTPSYGIAITGTDPVVELKNNIFYTTQTAALGANPAAFSYGIGMTTTAAATTNLNSDFNDFWSTGANDMGFRLASLGTAGGVDFATVGAWSGAVADDVASQESDPVFISPANDLHLNGLTPTPLLGDGLTGFATVDHDNDPRPATGPEIGADELVQAAAGVFPAGIFYNAISAPGDQMAGSATITNSMTLNGILNTGNFNVLTMGCDATFANVGGGNYVVGTVNKQYCATGAFTYPVGTTPDNALSGGKGNDNGIAPPEYTPVSVTVTGGTFPSFLSARVFDGTLIGFDPLQSLSRNWELTELGDITADLTFTYLDGAITDVNGTEASYITYRRNANGTTDPMCVALCVDTVNNMLTGVTGVTQFSRWSGAALVPTAAGVDVSGRVLTPNGGGLRNAIVTLTDSHGVTRTARSTTFGYYRFEDVRVGETYVLAVNSKRYIFTPRTVQVFDAVTGLDMTADGEQ